MGTTAEEQAALDRINQAAIKREAERLAAEDAARKAAEAAKASEGNQMVAGSPASVSWPDDGQAPAAPGIRDQVAGALRVGKAGDVAFARDLLNSAQAPLDGVNAQETTTDGAKEKTAGARGAKPALGLG